MCPKHVENTNKTWDKTKQVRTVLLTIPYNFSF